MDNFKAELDDKLKSGIVTEHSNFKNIYIHKFSIILLQQRKKMRFNNSLFVTKTLQI